MKIDTVKISDLKPAEYNPRSLSKEEFKNLKASLESFGFVEPVIVNSSKNRLNIVIGGHQRLKVAESLGIKDVPVHFVEIEDEKKEKELNLRLNRNVGHWDWDMLANFEIEELLSVGFGKEELEKNLEIDLNPPLDEQEFDSSNVQSITKPGDLWILGNHRLLCGDSTKKEDVGLLMNGEKANLVFTDPPYGVSYSKKNSFLNSIDEGNRIQESIENDEWDEDETCEFWFKSFEIIRDVLAEVNSYYIFGPQIQGMMMMMMMMMKAKLPYKHVIIWVKNNHVLGRCNYNYRHEPIFFGWTNTHKFERRGDFLTSVWEVDKPLKNDLHPTMKPIELSKNAILNSSEENEICLDPFAGSGSTLIGCEQTNRRFYGLEIVPKYCDVIIKRWEHYTGKKAVNLREDLIVNVNGINLQI